MFFESQKKPPAFQLKVSLWLKGFLLLGFKAFARKISNNFASGQFPKPRLLTYLVQSDRVRHEAHLFQTNP